MILNTKLDIMATSLPSLHQIENRLRERRQAAGLSQKQLADRVGITRQAVAAVETNLYCPATSVSLQLADALRCRVEDLFRIRASAELIDAKILGPLPQSTDKIRAQVLQIGDRFLVRSLDGSGELSSLNSGADGLIVGGRGRSRRVKVELLSDREALRRRIVIGGCDPGVFLAADHLSRHNHNRLVPCLMGNRRALGALKRGEIHVAGVHTGGERDDAQVITNLHRSLGIKDLVVVTFAHWEAGLIVQRGNAKRIRSCADLVRPRMRMINRERGSGARRLLDRQLKNAGISPTRIKGYGDTVSSHLEVAARIKAGLADVGVGVRAASGIYGLDFVPLQRERYDWVIPRIYYETLPGVRMLLDTVVEKRFRDELEALGGYDTREIGRLVDPAQ